MSEKQAKSRKRAAFPAHLRTTPAKWRALKRQEFLELRQALDRYQYGAAYTPAQASLQHLGRAVREIEEALREDFIAW